MSALLMTIISLFLSKEHIFHIVDDHAAPTPRDLNGHIESSQLALQWRVVCPDLRVIVKPGKMAHMKDIISLSL